MIQPKKVSAIQHARNLVSEHGSYAAAGRAFGLAPAHFWLADNDEYVTPKLFRAMGLGRKRYRLAADFASAEERDRFRRECLNGVSFSEWVYNRWREMR